MPPLFMGLLAAPVGVYLILSRVRIAARRRDRAHERARASLLNEERSQRMFEFERSDAYRRADERLIGLFGAFWLFLGVICLIGAIGH